MTDLIIIIVSSAFRLLPVIGLLLYIAWLVRAPDPVSASANGSDFAGYARSESRQNHLERVRLRRALRTARRSPRQHPAHSPRR